MDYSLLLAVHNISKEMKSKETFSSSHETPAMTSKELVRTSTDSGIALTNISNLPTYIQYIRVIEFIRAQQESSILQREYSISDHPYETASIQTVKPEFSPIIQSLDEQNHVLLRMNSQQMAGSFNLTNGLIGGDIWYNRQSLSRLAMYD